MPFEDLCKHFTDIEVLMHKMDTFGESKGKNALKMISIDKNNKVECKIEE